MMRFSLINLNENDIKRIIAEKFHCNEDEVKLKVSHGDPQYPEDRINAEIRIIN